MKNNGDDHGKNDGLDDLLGVNLSCVVTVDGMTIYNKIKIIAIPSGMSQIVEFDSTLSYNQEALAKATFVIEANNDQVLGNDTMETSFNFIQGLGVDEYIQSNVIAYPNPFKNYIKVSSEKLISSVRLIDMFGRVVYQDKDVNRLMVKFDVDVQKGFYILEIHSGDEWYKLPITRE